MATNIRCIEKLYGGDEYMSVEECMYHLLYDVYLAGWRAYANDVRNPKDSFIDFVTSSSRKITTKPSKDDLRAMMNEILCEETK